MTCRIKSKHGTVHCPWCRNNAGTSSWPKECPEGYTTDRLPIGLGDVIGAIATPIARALRLPCVDQTTGGLKPESPCARRKRELNKVQIR